MDIKLTNVLRALSFMFRMKNASLALRLLYCDGAGGRIERILLDISANSYMLVAP